MTQPKHKLSHGIFIAIEGIDGAGKTTQAKLLCDALSKDGYETLYLKEPTDAPYGRRIRALANEGRHDITPFEEFQLFLKDRKQDVEENIRPALAAGKIVVIDRYFYSSVAYQGARGLDPHFIDAENRKIAICPDIVIYLAIPATLTPERIENNRGDSANLFEKLEYLKKVEKIFDNMEFPEIWQVDGSGSIEEIHRKIYERIQDIIRQHSR